MPPAGEDLSLDAVRKTEPETPSVEFADGADSVNFADDLETEPAVEAVLREPPLDSTLLARPPRPDIASLGLALGGTFVLRCASYAAGLLVLVSLGIKSRDEANL